MLLVPQCTWMGVPPQKQIIITYSPPIYTHETPSAILCTQQHVCPVPSRNEAVVVMAGSLLSQSYIMQSSGLYLRNDSFSSRNCLLCLLPVNQALINLWIDQVTDGSIGSKKYRWIKKSYMFTKNMFMINCISQLIKTRKITFLLSIFYMYVVCQSNNHTQIRKDIVVFQHFLVKGG